MNPLAVVTFWRNTGLPLTVRLSFEWTRPHTESPVIQNTPFSRFVIHAKSVNVFMLLLLRATSIVSRYVVTPDGARGDRADRLPESRAERADGERSRERRPVKRLRHGRRPG